jgi:hypothetical protein
MGFGELGGVEAKFLQLGRTVLGRPILAAQ